MSDEEDDLERREAEHECRRLVHDVGTMATDATIGVVLGTNPVLLGGYTIYRGVKAIFGKMERDRRREEGDD